MNSRLRYDAASAAVSAAAGRDVDLPVVTAEEWAYLSGLAHRWLRAELAEWTEHASDPKAAASARKALTSWRADAFLAPVPRPGPPHRHARRRP